MSDLTMRANGYGYRSMILGFKRKVPQGNRGAMVDVLENTETVTMELPHLVKSGKPVAFTWKINPEYPTRPFETALLVDFPTSKFKTVC